MVMRTETGKDASRFEELAAASGMSVEDIGRLDALSRTAEMDPAIARAVGRPEKLTPEEETELADLTARYNEGVDRILAAAA